ncbi:HNH endonuclease signature motif containing protein [Streptomyces europaeiscabiei]|uniref:HNH endonuclease signature motif containing protein n=1 Tax=Streptomyces europaeiscabiei TaxID=146819 RepID=A0AAJ2UQV5_9ACTN|nr:HNH endonuclease signature motif containing protein [Streptomyces europaeiscabiei]MDX3135973.1 HNH endonuclease signature motif containing protein [Streptomyces europaeiscabiei]
MPQGRTAIPAEVKRAVLVEAGHRCAIPTCRVGTTEIAHVKPWRQVRDHTFENLIALCPTCHTRFDRGEIDRKAMQQYKANLGVINGRYGEIERRVLTIFAENPDIKSIPMPAASDVAMLHLVKDGIFRRGLARDLALIIPNGSNAEIDFVGGTQEFYTITEKGRDLVQRLAEARALA